MTDLKSFVEIYSTADIERGQFTGDVQPVDQSPQTVPTGIYRVVGGVVYRLSNDMPIMPKKENKEEPE